MCPLVTLLDSANQWTAFSISDRFISGQSERGMLYARFYLTFLIYTVRCGVVR
jgi:hypothetical protein